MKAFITGTRGIPNIPGGVETHCEKLYPLIVHQGYDICLAVRNTYVNNKIEVWKGVRLIPCKSPKNKFFEAIIHTSLALLKARRYNPDLIHIHSIGPALMIPFARLLGFKVVFTHHGPDYKRQKWGITAKLVLRLGELAGCLFANKIIAISREIKDNVKKQSNRNAELIYNGVSFPMTCPNTDFLNKIQIKSGKYFLAVARFVPEKGLHDLIHAFKRIKSDFHLVIAGEADHATEYSNKLKLEAETDPRIILTGYIKGEPLHQLYTHAGLFILPSYHEGLPISLLEAMSYGLPILASDIRPNLEVALPPHRYFQCGNVNDLKNKMAFLSMQMISEEEKHNLLSLISEKYNWEKIAEQTAEVYEKICQT